MSDKSSHKIRGWALVNTDGDVENSDDGSTSSSDFVHLEEADRVASYHHHHDHSSSPEILNPVASSSSGSDMEEEPTIVSDPGNVPTPRQDNPTRPLGEMLSSSPESGDLDFDVVEQHGGMSKIPVGLENAGVQDLAEDDAESDQPEMEDPVRSSQGFRSRPAEDDLVSDPEGSSIELLSAPSTVSSGDPQSSGEDPDSLGDSSEAEDVTIMEKKTDPDVHNLEAMSSSSKVEETERKNSKHSEETVKEPETTQDQILASLTALVKPKLLTKRLTRSLLSHKTLRQCSSESDSDHSDFVRLRGTDPPLTVSTSSEGSMASSVSSSFRFVHPVARPRAHQCPQHPFLLEPGHYHGFPAYVADDDDDASLPPDVDDRCESDISGVANDDSDSDLSAMIFIGDLPLTAGNVARSYKHRPNQTLNAILNIMALLALSLAIGIGIGHYMGSVREINMRHQQVLKMKSLQDDYLMCLRRQDILQSKAAITDEEKIAAVTAVWKAKYEELIIEKVELDSVIRNLNKEMSRDLEGARVEMDSQQNVTKALETQVDALSSKLNAYAAQLHHQATVMEDQNALTSRVDDLQIQIKSVQDQLMASQQQVQDAVLDRDSILRAAELELSSLKADHQLSAETRQMEVSRLQTEVSGLLGQIQKMTEVFEAKAASLAVENEALQQGQHDDVLHWKSLINQLENENADLRSLVAKMRYSMPAVLQDPHSKSGSDSSSNPEDADVTGRVEEVVVSAVEPPDVTMATTASPTIDDGNATENTETSERESKGAKEEFTPSFWTCMGLLFPKVTLPDVETYLKTDQMKNLTESFEKQWAFFQNITADAQFSDMVIQKWGNLKSYVDPEGHQDLADRATVQDIQEAVGQRWEQFQHYTRSTQFQDSIQYARDGLSKVSNATQNMTITEKFHKLFNRTKDNVSKLSKKVEKTWKKIKNLSNDVMKKNKSLRSFGDSVQNNIKDFGKKLKSGWDAVTEQLAHDGWISSFTNKAVPKKKDEKNGKKQHKKWNKPPAPPAMVHQQQHSTFSNSAPSSEEEDFKQSQDEMPKDNQQFERKPQYKQKQSNAETKYAEFWKKADFDPDDFIQEGFFEGNNREWHKHQKRIRKINGRMQRLNEQIFLAMDDDDIEEMYEDWDDIEDDFDDLNLQPEKLKNWLTCQVRWWKSRIYRKHIKDDDLIKGCGKLLMNWQLRAMCKPRCLGKAKKCKKGAREAGDFAHSAFCQYLSEQSVINSVPQGKSSANPPQALFGDGYLAKTVRRGQMNPAFSDEPYVNLGHMPNKKDYRHGKSGDIRDSNQPTMFLPFDDAKNETDSSQEGDGVWYFQRAQDRENHLVNPKWYFNWIAGREHIENQDTCMDVNLGARGTTTGDAPMAAELHKHRWIFERAEDRESHHHDGRWLFQRAGERKFVRTQPWYYKRAQDRAARRGKGNQGHYHGHQGHRHGGYGHHGNKMKRRHH